MGNHDEFLLDAKLVHTYNAAPSHSLNRLDPVPPVSGRAPFPARLRTVLGNHAGEIDVAALPQFTALAHGGHPGIRAAGGARCDAD
jgi:hypothetical protein